MNLRTEPYTNDRQKEEGPQDSSRLPFRVSQHIKSLFAIDDQGVIKRQFIPSPQEEVTTAAETTDPLAEKPHSPLPRLIHRYRDRVLVLTTGQCAAYCRFCFRSSFTAGEARAINGDEIDAILGYLDQRREVHEVLFSGGDPLTLSNHRINGLLSAFRSQSEERVFRIATRMPIVQPRRIDPQLVEIFQRNFPLWVVIQVNHPLELCEESKRALALLRRGGIPILSQTVLLRNINDSVDTLRKLFYGLEKEGVKPYYLFQGDLARGTSHFRVPLEEGIRIVKALRREVSGLVMPTYAVDLPGGGGKIPLTESYFIGESESGYHFRSLDGTEHSYPKEG